MKAHRLIAIFLAALAITAQAVYASTAEELKATIEAYGLSAAVSPTPNEDGNTVVIVTGEKNDATDALELDHIDYNVEIVWLASLTGNNSTQLINLTDKNPTPPPPPQNCPVGMFCIYLPPESFPGKLNVQGGKIEQTGTGDAIYCSYGDVHITGGTVLAKNGYAVNSANNSGASFSGGLAFAYGSTIMEDVINNEHNIYSSSAVIAWNKNAGNTTYTALDAKDISGNATAKWDARNGGGIMYTSANGTNKGFVRISDVTVKKATDAATIAIKFPSTSASTTFGNDYELTIDNICTGEVTYAITSGTGEGTISGSTLKITKAGTFKITATRAGDENCDGKTSANTFTLTVNKASQTTLTINSPSTHTFGTDYELTTTGGSGTGAVTYAISTSGTTGEGTISGSTLNITKAGTFKITATKAADDNYNSIKSSTFTLMVKEDQAPLIISSPTTHISGTTYTLATTGGSGTGKVTYAKIGGTGICTVSTSGSITTSCSKMGTIIITATKAADNNYNSVTSSEFILTVKKSQTTTLKINSTPTSITFGTDYTLKTTGGIGNGAVTYTITGGTGAGTISGSTLTPTKAGTIIITATKAEDDTYWSQTSSEFTLTVNKTTDLNIQTPVSNQMISSGHTGENAFDLSTITLNKDDHGTLSYTLGEFVDASGILTAKPTLDSATLTYIGTGKESGEATQEIIITSENYEDFTVIITFEATPKKQITISGLTLQSSYTYDGAQKTGYTGTIVGTLESNGEPYLGDFVIAYAGTAYDSTATPPTNAGEYTLKILVPSDNPYYTGELRHDFTIAKAIPIYTVPTGLTATVGQTLANVPLPTGWAWVTPTASLGTAGTQTNKANYIPTDVENYNDVPNIDVSITVNANTPIHPQIATGSIKVQTTANAILLSNLPRDTKIEVYTLQGKRVYSAYPENPRILRIGVQTKGMYIVKAGSQTTRVAVR